MWPRAPTSTDRAEHDHCDAWPSGMGSFAECVRALRDVRAGDQDLANNHRFRSPIHQRRWMGPAVRGQLWCRSMNRRRPGTASRRASSYPRLRMSALTAFGNSPVVTRKSVLLAVRRPVAYWL